VNRRKFIKNGAIWVPAIFIPKLLAGPPGKVGYQPRTAAAGGGGGGCTTSQDSIAGATTGSISTQNTKYIGQRFTAGGSYTACKVVLRAEKGGAPAGNVECHLYSHNSAGSGTPNASLGSASKAFASIPAAGEADVEFTGLSVALTNATVYWVVVFDTAGGAFGGDGLIWYWESSGAVTNNNVLSSDGSSWSELGNNTRFKFTVYS
jgi:hypothetical protein